MSRVAAVAAVAALAAAAPAHAAPRVSQLVVFRNGSAVQKHVTASQVSVKVGKKHCAVGWSVRSSAKSARVRSSR